MLAIPLLLALAAPASTTLASADTTPINCDNCATWNRPHAPFRLVGNSYYVGVEGISAVLIADKAGLVLIDGDLPQSASRIADNIRKLGFRVEDVKWIVNSHAHFDHAGGIAALQRMSGAKVAASKLGAQALRAGSASADDPQFVLGDVTNFPRIANVTEVADGEVIALGRIRLTAHYTPGHTPGGTSWSWRDCAGEVCHDLVFADSLSPISATGFRFTADGGARVAQFRHSIAVVRALACDVLVPTHPDASDLFENQAKRGKNRKRDALIDANACRAYADTADARLTKRVAEEQADPSASH
ncbi:MAG TPA: subclass B3 metallo-beta-lactamase [Arenimonas sp.]|uniref:subclass B3 metallo-beta-lactamase n=1 Tax=Arenimonas sp. TaxID=1872635 RepID=UPI002CD0C113|nr:subclass B3 metallo-beta-lactamase [Arenimonas sp.]HMB55617.1 subclass B3 metallo-beta-lactamase [Arenimonas sp.]